MGGLQRRPQQPTDFTQPPARDDDIMLIHSSRASGESDPWLEMMPSSQEQRGGKGKAPARR